MWEIFWRIAAVTIIIELGLILRAVWELRFWLTP
jgi:hypothetical protein